MPIHTDNAWETDPQAPAPCIICMCNYELAFMIITGGFFNAPAGLPAIPVYLPSYKVIAYSHSYIWCRVYPAAVHMCPVSGLHSEPPPLA